MGTYTFHKTERLCNRSIISRLYESPGKFVAFPLSVYWMLVPNGAIPSRMQVLVVAPKRRLHHAVDRNRTKRLMRECWRHCKEPLISLLRQHDKSMVVGISYIHNRPPDFHKLTKSFDTVVKKISSSCQ
ncbi:MAG: ribonuclease P protein component [Bacteroidales bacterium]|nr:ribonuclease P protein component [Bacteroidales bacterium]